MEKNNWECRMAERTRSRVWRFDDEFRRRFYNSNDAVCHGVKLLWEHVREMAMSDDPRKVADADDMLDALFDHRDLSHDAWMSERWPAAEVKLEEDMTDDEIEEANMTLEELYL